MRDNKALALQESRGKEHADGQTSQISEPSLFWFPVYEGLFEHAPIIRDAVWLFMWLIGRTTREANGRGAVLGGVPIHDERPARELRFPVKTIRRWRRMLIQGGYIETVRTPYGFKYTLLKSKKRQIPQKRDLPKLPISRQESAQIGHRELPLREERVPDSGVSKKTIQGQHREEAEDATAAAGFPPPGKNRKVFKEAWEAIEIEPCGSIRFCRMWEYVYAEAAGGDWLVDIMERAIQECQGSGIRVPPPFFAAKRLLEKDRVEEEPDEMARFGGPRGIPEELMR